MLFRLVSIALTGKECRRSMNVQAIILATHWNSSSVHHDPVLEKGSQYSCSPVHCIRIANTYSINSVSVTSPLIFENSSSIACLSNATSKEKGQHGKPSKSKEWNGPKTYSSSSCSCSPKSAATRRISFITILPFPSESKSLNARFSSSIGSLDKIALSADSPRNQVKSKRSRRIISVSFMHHI